MMVRLAGLLGCTEGQAYTILIALTLSLSLAALGLPPTLEPRAAGPIAAPGAPSEGDTAGDVPPGQQLTPDDEETGSDDAPLDLPESTAVDGGQLPEMAGGPSDAGDIGPDVGQDGSPEIPAAPPAAEGLDELGAAGQFGAAAIFTRVEEPGAPHGLAVGPDGAVYVATDNTTGRGVAGPPTVTRYDRDGRLEATMTLEDPGTGSTYGLLGLAVDDDGRLLAVDPDAARILELDLDGDSVSTYAEIPDLRPCLLTVGDEPCEPGGVDQDPLPRDAVFDGDGALYVSDAGQGTIWRIPPDGAAEVWHQADDYVLRRPPDGGLGGLAFDQYGDLLAVVTTSFADAAFGRGIVYRVAVSSSGAAGSRVELARTEQGEEPVGVAVGESGRIYLPLSAADELLVLEPDGGEAERIGADDVGGQAGVPLDAPTDVAFHGDALLVTNKSTLRNDADHWAVLRLQVLESEADPWARP